MKITPRIVQQQHRPENEPITTPARKITHNPYAAIDQAYAETTAPRADLSKLIVDPRPEHANPLLRQEVEALRLRAKLAGQSGTASPHKARTHNDTLIESAIKRPPGLSTHASKKSSLAAMLSKGYVMGRGYRGEEAVELKKLMADHGLNVSDGNLFDDLTHDELQRFQQYYDIKPTGIVDNATYAALRR